jgi:hypothetical protein
MLKASYPMVLANDGFTFAEGQKEALNGELIHDLNDATMLLLDHNLTINQFYEQILDQMQKCFEAGYNQAKKE